MTQLPMNKTLFAFVILLTTTSVAPSFAVAERTRQHPNIVFIMADDVSR